MSKFLRVLFIANLAIWGTACTDQPSSPVKHEYTLNKSYQSQLSQYKDVALTTDLSHLSGNQKQMLVLLIEASKVIDDLYWLQVFNQDKHEFLAQISNPALKQYVNINYGPWDRLNNNASFVNDISAKAKGAGFYPKDLTKAEFENSTLESKDSLYSIIQRDKNNQLFSINYSEFYIDQLNRVALILEKAATLADDKDFALYLKLRAEALRTDEYQESDMAWMEMKNNPIELVIGPIETYEDQLFGYKAAFESLLLIKDQSWSKQLAHYTKHLKALQKALPVPKKYKKEMPGNQAELNVYDAIYLAGEANAGSKAIAINLPNDEEVQKAKGTRRLQIKNTMKAKFDHILMPISQALITPKQRKHITFNAFFTNTMFHEVAHGLGIKNVLKSDVTVRKALKELASSIEEGKADVLSLFMVRYLYNKKQINTGSLEDYYTTFMASMIRSIRFGISSSHGKANMIRFNYFLEQGAFTRNSEGYYQVNMKIMTLATEKLSEKLLILQGDGNYNEALSFSAQYSQVNTQLQEDLIKLTSLNIPVDITFIQGKSVLGL